VNFCEHYDAQHEPTDRGLREAPHAKFSSSRIPETRTQLGSSCATRLRRTLESTDPSVPRACLYRPKARGAFLISSADGAAMLNVMPACMLEVEFLKVSEAFRCLEEAV